MSPDVFSSSLECKNSYSIFNQINKKQLDIYKNFGAEEYLNFIQEYDYTTLFAQKHPNQIFDGSRWISLQEFYALVEEINSQENTMPSEERFLEIKANQILSVGEVCVIPKLIIHDEFEEISNFKVDIIWIRNLQTNKWRYLYFVNQNLNKDFYEFIPDFPKSIQLSTLLDD